MIRTDIVILIFIILLVICLIAVPILFKGGLECYKISTDLSSEVYICKDYDIDRNNFSIYLSMSGPRSPIFGFDDSNVVVVKYSEFYQIEEVRSPSLFERWFCE